jgi:hypothetical protein
MYPTVWLDGARPANTFIPPPYVKCTIAAALHTYQKNTFASVKN